MESDKEKIISYSKEKFFKEGFYKTTMDGLASELQMSKKTIYKYFPSKENLVQAVSEYFRNSIASKIGVLLNDPDDNAIIKFVKLVRFISEVSLKISPKMLADMQKHMPGMWKQIDEFRTKMMTHNLTKMVAQGKKEKLIRDYPDIIIVNVFIASVRSVVNPEFLVNNSFSFKQALEFTFEILLNGVLTEKGKEVYTKSKSRINNED